jgi:hypothetical protein
VLRVCNCSRSAPRRCDGDAPLRACTLSSVAITTIIIVVLWAGGGCAQVALEVGVCGPDSAWSRADCRNLLMQLARAYPPTASTQVCFLMAQSPHCSRSLLGTLLSALQSQADMTREADTDGFLLLHRLMQRPSYSALGNREPLEDGHLTDTATLLIDRNMASIGVRAGAEQRTPLLWLVRTWRESITPPPPPPPTPPSATGGGQPPHANATNANANANAAATSATGYAATVQSYAAFHGLEETLAITACGSGRDSPGGHLDQMVTVIVLKIIQGRDRFGDDVWAGRDQEGRSALEYARESSMFQTEEALAEVTGKDANRSLAQVCADSDVAEDLPAPPPSQVRMKKWKDAFSDKLQARASMPLAAKDAATTALSDMDEFDRRLGTMKDLPEGKEAGFEYDSDDDFLEEGFTMDVSSNAENELEADRPRSRLQSALHTDPRGVTPAPGDPNVLGVLAFNTAVASKPLQVLLEANPSLASRTAGPEDDDPDMKGSELWPYPLHILCLNPSINSIEPGVFRRLIELHEPALLHWAAVKCPGSASGSKALQAPPLHLLCMNPHATVQHLSVMLDCLADYEPALHGRINEWSELQSIVHREVEELLPGSRNGGSAFRILCRNPGPILDGCGEFLKRYPSAAMAGTLAGEGGAGIGCTRVRQPVTTKVGGAGEEAEENEAVVKFSAAGGTCLHALAANIACSEDIVHAVAKAAPDCAALVDERGCLPLHLLCANPGPKVDQWCVKRLVERTPRCALHWCTEAPHARSCMAALRAPKGVGSPEGEATRLELATRVLTEFGAQPDCVRTQRDDVESSVWREDIERLIAGAEDEAEGSKYQYILDDDSMS